MSKLQLLAWGANNYGQLANGQPCEQLERPLIIQGIEPDPEICVELGGGHSLLLDRGRVYAAGWNSKGQCGDNGKQDLCEFKRVLPERDDFVDVAAGWDFTLCLDDKGVVFGCGSNTFGQLGLGDQVKNVCEVTKLDIKEKVIKMAAGMRHSLFLLEDGSLCACGSGKKGQLCDTEKANLHVIKHIKLEKKAIDIKAGQNFSIVIFDDGTFTAYGEDKYGQVSKINQLFKKNPSNDCNILYSTNVKQIEVGWTHILILLKNGRLEAFGRQDYGQINCTEAQNIVFTQISSGYEHCLAISDSQDLYSWGWNEHGNCGLGHTENILTPTKVLETETVIKCFAGSGHSFALVKT